MLNFQPGILAPLPPAARYLAFDLVPGGDPQGALRALQLHCDGAACVCGIGPGLVAALGRSVPGLHPFPDLSAAAVTIPATPHTAWCWLRGDERGEVVLRSQRLVQALGPDLAAVQVVDAFVHAGGRDLTGYEDGTENPAGDAARGTAIVDGRGAGLDGSSYVAVQQWEHDFAAFDAMPPADQDHAIGRRRSDNEELDEAPESAHVKRTAQESFSPEAFVWRRSMPWADGAAAGLMFVAYGHSLEAFEVQLRRMAGIEDGIVDALFGFSRPRTGAYYWCPPCIEGRLDLRALGLA
ncbi:MAG: Dyp-type peroxidase [Rhodocyclaceae bacterium]|nr:Dyp-type peroxidase [Rhodocyclaceae bacterium]